MPQDVPKTPPSTPPPYLAEPAAHSPAFALLVTAFAGTIALLWGFETRACDGIVAGLIAAMMRATFLAFTHLPEFVLLAAVFAVHLAVAHLVARHRPFRKREELLATVLPLASFFAGLFVAGTTWVEGTCALHPWR